MLTENEQFTFFWSGPFSQWHKCSFMVKGSQYNCTEQFMMAQKALLFGDQDTYHKVMLEKDPREQKRLGRQIINFDKAVWDKNRFTIVLMANIAKFSQNPDLRQTLMDTELTTMVEASPLDNIWGIGLGVETKDGDPVPEVHDRTQWEGINLLGQVLTQVREMLKVNDYFDINLTVPK